MIGFGAAAAADPAVVGTKFARLAAIRAQATVPDAWCLPAAWFEAALGAERLAALQGMFHDLATTVGSELADLDERLARILHGLTVPINIRAALQQIAVDGPLAVRSSTSVEDGMRHSHAGLYESHLHLRRDQIPDAILACWHSFYAPRAVVARLRSGDIDSAPRMGVIIQRMVDADLAGVAFTHRSATLVSATVGTGEHLVGGSSDAPTFAIATPQEAPPPYDQVALVAAGLKDHLGNGEVDVEWAWNKGEGLAVLQVRPVTADLPGLSSPAPRFAAASLYFTDQLPVGVELGACAQLYAEVTSKRSPLFRLAAEHGITVGDGWVVTLNGAGLAAEERPPWHDLSPPGVPAEVVIDAGAAIRQNIVPTDRVEPLLETALNLRGDPHALHTVLVRCFVRGRAGALTQRRPDGSTVMQHSAQGLIALNRGLAIPDEAVLAPLDDPTWARQLSVEQWSATALRQMAAFTAVVDGRLPGACLEWVLTDQGDPQFVDFSAIDASWLASTTAGRTLSEGSARGPLLAVGDSEILERLSVAPIISIGHTARVPDSAYITALRARIADCPTKPILHASRPYVILSQVIGDVAGMVFDGGSTMCHLAILLREAGLPAVVAPRFDIDRYAGQSAAIGGGVLRLLTDPAQPTGTTADREGPL
ncbi:PEP/pyruvate-binding domain-containing protein [Nonomuraea jabiensis]|uniref:PEP/pyruvate-binding domain-containing protein n=1 Tax=Nonomuraea jabiensis TaxID=882448 RepID=UPI003D72B40F